MLKEKRDSKGLIKSFRQDCNESDLDKWANIMVEMHEKKKRMYHYTSLDTFMKILSGIEGDAFIFRAGSVYTMNDSQEMILGYNYIKKYLPCVEENLKVKQEEKLFNLFKDKKKNKDVKKMFGDWLINDDTTNFVVSFSSTPDILPMWSLYGDHGSGVCLEFSPYIIKEYYNKNNIEKNLQIEECVYKENDIEEVMMRVLAVVYKYFLSRNNEEQRINPLTKAKYLATMCGITCAYVKHHCFEYEKEVRMNVFRHIKEWVFDESRNGHRIVYVKVPIPIDAMTGIIVGPAVDMSKVRNALIMSLRAKGIHIEPIQSEIPFRIY